MKHHTINLIDTTVLHPGTGARRWVDHLNEVLEAAVLDLTAAPAAQALLVDILRGWGGNRRLHRIVDRSIDALTIDQMAFTLPPVSRAVARHTKDERARAALQLRTNGWLIRVAHTSPPAYRAAVGQPFGARP